MEMSVIVNLMSRKRKCIYIKTLTIDQFLTKKLSLLEKKVWNKLPGSAKDQIFRLRYVKCPVALRVRQFLCSTLPHT